MFHDARKLWHVSEKHKDVAQSLLILLSRDPPRFADAFREMQLRRWSPSTAAAHLGTMLTLCKMLGRSELTWPIDQLRRTYTQQAQQAGPRWDPMDPAQVMRPEDLQRLLAAPVAAAPLLVTFITGHRIGDVLQFEVDNVRTVRFSGPKLLETLVIMVTAHKTVKTTGPYALHLPMTSWTARLIMTCCHQQRAAKKPFLFMDFAPATASPEQRRSWVTTTETSLKNRFLPTHDLRALRRGGLTSMSLAGFTEEQILFASRHTDTQGLQTYLGHGIMSLQAAQIMTDLYRHNEDAILAGTHPATFSGWPS